MQFSLTIQYRSKHFQCGSTHRPSAQCLRALSSEACRSSGYVWRPRTGRHPRDGCNARLRCQPRSSPKSSSDRSIRIEHGRNGRQHRSSVSETWLRSRACRQPLLPSARNQTGIPASGCRRFHRPRQTEVSASQRRFHARSRNSCLVGLLLSPVDWPLTRLAS